MQELPGPSQSEQSPARPQRPSPQDAHLSPQAQVRAVGVENMFDRTSAPGSAPALQLAVDESDHGPGVQARL